MSLQIWWTQGISPSPSPPSPPHSASVGRKIGHDMQEVPGNFKKTWYHWLCSEEHRIKTLEAWTVRNKKILSWESKDANCCKQLNYENQMVQRFQRKAKNDQNLLSVSKRHTRAKGMGSGYFPLKPTIVTKRILQTQKATVCVACKNTKPKFRKHVNTHTHTHTHQKDRERRQTTVSPDAHKPIFF